MAALSYTYATLLAALQSWPVDSESAYVTELPVIIKQGELFLTRELGLEIFDVNTTATITSGDGTITKPTAAAFVAPRALWYATGGVTYHLTRATPDFVRAYAANGTSGLPRYYSEENETTWELAPTPNFSGTLNIRQTLRAAGLDEAVGGSTSWLSTKMPDLLFLSCLMRAERFLKNEPRWARAKTDFDLMLPDAKAEVAQLRQVRAEDQTVLREIVRPENSDAKPQNQ